MLSASSFCPIFHNLWSLLFPYSLFSLNSSPQFSLLHWTCVPFSLGWLRWQVLYSTTLLLEGGLLQCISKSFFFLLIEIDSQCYVSFKCTAQWLLYILFQILFHYRLLQNIEFGFLCYTIGLCWLFILYIIMCIIYQLPNLSLPSPFPFGNHKFVFYVCESLSVLQINSFVSFFLDFTCKWYLIFVFALLL